jgi:hypothetical protein
VAVSFGAAARSDMLFWSDRLLGIISRFDNSADAVGGAVRPVDEGKAVGVRNPASGFAVSDLP